LSHYL